MKLLLIIFLLGSILCNAQTPYATWYRFDSTGKLVITKDTAFIKNVGDYQEGKVNVLVTPSGRKSVVTIEEEALGPEGVNPYIETLIFDNTVVILCLKEYRIGKETFIDTIAVDYYRKAVFLNPINYNLIITKKDLEFQKLIARKLNEKE